MRGESDDEIYNEWRGEGDYMYKYVQFRYKLALDL